MPNSPSNGHDNKKNPKTDLYQADQVYNQLQALKIPKTSNKSFHKPASGQDAAKGFAASMHIVSGVLVGGLIGYGIDYIVGTLPFGTVIMLPIGMIAGFRNMIRSLDTGNEKS